MYLTGNCKQLIQKNDKYISPFLVENQLQQIPEINHATIVEHQNKIVLVVETNSKSIDNEYFNNIKHDELIVVSHIPKAPRHQSKIDYGALDQLLTKTRFS